MPATGIAPARELTGPANGESDHSSFETRPAVPARVRQGAHWFFWIVGLVATDSVLTIIGSGFHRFIGLGVTAIIGAVSQSGASSVMHVMVNVWVAVGFLLLGYCAAEGWRWAFITGMGAYAVDAGLLIATRDYLSFALHIVMLGAIFSGFLALDQSSNQSSSAEPPDAASAAHAG